MSRLTSFLFSTLLISTVTSQSTVSFTANLSGPSTFLRFPITNCVGSSHFAMSLREDYRAHLRAIQNDIGFNYIRGHGIMDDDVSTYLGGGPNMFNVFSTFDFYLSINIYPIVEISFMPISLAQDPTQTVFHYRGGTSPPASFSQWYTYIYDFTSALVERYGVETVRNFKFEVWNEPNCGFYDAKLGHYVGYGFGISNGDNIVGCCGSGCGNQTSYFLLYNATARAVKAVDPFLRVGGPATAQLGWFPEFLEYVSTTNAPVDFVSSHLYPSDSFLNQTADGFIQAIANASNIAQNAGLPLTVTEFNAGLGLPENDGPYGAAAIMHIHLNSQSVPNVDTLSFWTFSDIFEEGGLISQPYTSTPKYGMQTIYGVPKPVYRAFQMISKQPNAAVPVVGSGIDENGESLRFTSRVGGATVGTVDAMVSTASDGRMTAIVALVTNYDLWGQPTPPNTTVTLAIQNIPSNAVVSPTAGVEYLDSTHAYAKPVWEAAGSPTYPTPVEIADELAASQLVQETIPFTSLGNNAYSVTITLESYAVARITMAYVV